MKRRQRFDQINIVPFVDIVLVLLVIVLATATFIKQGSTPIKLPSSSSSPQTPKATATISIDANGSYYFDDKEMGWDGVKNKIVGLDINSSKILLRTDKRTPFEYFSKLITLLKKTGFKQVSIAGEAEQK